MESINEALQPIELSEFKNMGPHMPTTIIDIPEKPENRRPTDKAFIIAFAVCVVLLMPFLIYGLACADVRLLNGYDECGNICGTTNTKYEEWECSGKDYTDKMYLKPKDDDETTFQCVADCGTNFSDFFGVCVPSDNLKDLNMDWAGVRRYLSGGMVIFKLIICSLITVGISVAILYVFKYAIKVVVWGIIIGVFILSIIVVGMTWSSYSSGANDALSLTLSLTSTIFLVVYMFMVYKSRDRIPLVILLLTESTNAVFAMPSLVIVPIGVFFVDTIIITLWLTTTVYMSTAGELIRNEDTGRMAYELGDGMGLIIFYNGVLTIWSLYFVSGLQYMVVAGAVSEWYFANDKTIMYQPVRKSFNIAYKFHLGTVMFGSLIIALAQLVRMMIKGLTKNRFTQMCVDYCLRNVLELLNFVNQNAYIVTAMHGQPFLKSGKRATQLLATNLSDVLIHRVIVKLTLFATILFIAFTSVLLSVLIFIGDTEVQYVPMALLIVFLMAAFAGTTFVSLLRVCTMVYKTSIDSIFICFCEDKMLNDGMARPYAMSRELMEFVDNAKKAVGKTDDYGQMDQQYPQPV